MKKMGRPRKVIKFQHSSEELKKLYQQSKCSIERRRTQAIWLLSEGKSAKEVHEITAYSNVNLSRIIDAYNEKGAEGLRDGRRKNTGRPTVLSDAEMLQLAQEIRKDYKKNMYWSGKDVINWVKEQCGRDIPKQRAYEYLKAIGMSLQTPRPHHAKADPIAQDIFKKNATQSA